MKRHELAESVPYGFPFVAMLRGQIVDYKRTDTPVIVQGLSGMERHYYRVQLPCGKFTVANDSMLYVIV